MRSLSIFLLLNTSVQLVRGFCDLTGAKRDVDFPDIEQYGIESFQMSVEYTVPYAQQTDFYTEYYDLIWRRGRIDSDQAGKHSTYIYYTETLEAFEVSERTCKLKNLTDVPEIAKDDMNDWLYTVGNDTKKRTYGPSAMLKIARDVWYSTSRKYRMAYMGVHDFHIRGVKAQYWRMCGRNRKSYVDYFFTTDAAPDPLGTGLKRIPLRVSFDGKREGQLFELAVQRFDITSFQPFISRDVHPFQLPKSLGCRRRDLVTRPKLPHFSGSNLQFEAEVIYKKVDVDNEDFLYWNYYSTLSIAIDTDSQHMAYQYTPWNSTESRVNNKQEVSSPESVVYDMQNGYVYRTILETGRCTIERTKSFYPTYKLPKKGGELLLTDGSLLFPSSGMTYVSEGIDRGLKVNLFEAVIENFIMINGSEITIPKAIISHSYLTDSEMVRNSVSVKNALVQIQVTLFGRQGTAETKEIVLFNFFNFNTHIEDRRYLFNIQNCFKSPDDYVWITIGFHPDGSQLNVIRDNVHSIENNVLNSLYSTTELSPVRVSYVMVDIKKELYVTLLIIEKPSVFWDFMQPEQKRTLIGNSDVQGVQTAESCAVNCLEERPNCWAFSICGAVCAYATSDQAKVVRERGCQLYRRYNNETYLQSKDVIVQNIQKRVETKTLKLVLIGKDDKMVQVEPSTLEVFEPGKDDHLINRIGNVPNPRMKVVRIGAKLKAAAGKQVKILKTMNFEKCQSVCLDYNDCETASFCLNDGECVVSSQFGENIDQDHIENNNFCIIVTRKYSDLFKRSVGNVVSLTAHEVHAVNSVEECAKVCHTTNKYRCLSFDHCPQSRVACKLHAVLHPNFMTRENIQVKDTQCGRYYRKISTEFKKNPNNRYLGSSIPPITNLTLEECSKVCNGYKKGCFGFDFCLDVSATSSCLLLDKHQSEMKTSFSEACTSFLRSEQLKPKLINNGYAGGIGFLCFMIGLIVGILVLFGISRLCPSSTSLMGTAHSTEYPLSETKQERFHHK